MVLNDRMITAKLIADTFGFSVDSLKNTPRTGFLKTMARWAPRMLMADQNQANHRRGKFGYN